MSAPEPNPERRRKLEELFLLASELTQAERSGLLARHCEGDPELRAELEALLLEDEEGTKDFLRAPELRVAATPGTGSELGSPSDAWLPERVGPYRVLEKIGEGGMGSVWLAEQEEPIRRRVALKFVRRSAEDGRTLERFEDERQALAGMDHPGIARILDGGSTEPGLCWFAMELAPGVPIDEFCDTAGYGVRERLALFLRVCEAVHHAHQKGIVHLDIKPSNVLVLERDGETAPKLIDFGIARAVGARSDPEEHRSRGVGTLHYMSPEQADPEREDVDIRSDVYSLSVLLYKLLARALPFDAGTFRARSWSQVAAFLRESTPPPPSERAPGIARALRGDLDWIAMTGMHPDPERRYASVAELAEDVRRHLLHEPLRVAPAGGLYRVRKALRRHKLAFLSGGLLLAALVGGVVGTTRGMFEAARQRDEAHDARRLALAQTERAQRITRFLAETISSAPGVTLDPRVTVREMLDRAAARLPGAVEDPESEAVLRKAIGDAYRSLGEVELAGQHLSRAVQLLDGLPDTRPIELYEALWSLVPVYDESDARRGMEVVLRANSVRQRLMGAENPELAREVERLRQVLLEGSVPVAAAVARLVDAAEAALEPGDPLWRFLAEELADQGFVLGLLLGDVQACELLAPSVAILRRELPANDPEIARHLLRHASVLAEAGDFAAAEPIAQEALAICDASLPPGHWRAQEARSLLGACRMGRGAQGEAEELLRTSHEALRAALGPSSRAALEAHCRLLRLVDRHGAPEEARRLRSSLAARYAFSPSVPGLWSRVATLFGAEQRALLSAMSDLRDALFAARAPDRRPESSARVGLESLRRVVELRRSLAADDPLNVVVARTLTEWLPLGGGVLDPRLHLSMAEEALAVLLPHQLTLPAFVADAEQSVAEALLAAGRPDEAREHCERAVALFRAELGERSFSTLMGRITLGSSLRAAGRMPAAEPVLAAASRDARAAYGAQDPLARDAARELELARAGSTTPRGER